MAFSVLQKGAGAASSTHVTFGSATTAGSCLIVLTVSNIAAGGCTAGGNTLMGGAYGAGHNGDYSGIWYLPDNPGGITSAQVTGCYAVGYLEVTGTAGYPQILAAAATGGNSTAVTSYTITNPGASTSNFTVFCVAYDANSGGTPHIDGSTGATALGGYGQFGYTTLAGNATSGTIPAQTYDWCAVSFAPATAGGLTFSTLPTAGVYRGPCGGKLQDSNTSTVAQAGIFAYEEWLGRPVAYVLDYLMEAPATWAQFEGGQLDQTSGSFSLLSQWGVLPNRWTMMLSLSACCGKSIGTGASTWAGEAAGTNDTHWTNLGNNLVTWGYGNACIRLGREWNGNWYNWSPAITGDSAANYIAGYQHIVTLLRGIPGNTFTFMWNPTSGQVTGESGGGLVPLTWYPGNAYVDSIGVDYYDWGTYPTQTTAPYAPRSAEQQQYNFAQTELGVGGLNYWATYAAANGKPLALPEWGLQLWLTGGHYIGGGDDTFYITQMANVAGYCFMQGMWEDTGVGLFDTDACTRRVVGLPSPDNSRALYLDLLGSTIAPPAGPGTAGASVQLGFPLWTDGMEWTSLLQRQLDGGAAVWDSNASATTVNPLGGVLQGPASPLALAPLTSPGMSVLVNAGYCAIPHPVQGDGVYLFGLVAQGTLTVAPNPATVARTDIVIARVYDLASASSYCDVEIISGTPGAGQPAMPGVSILLGTVTVAPSATSITTGNITDLRSFTAAPGGILPATVATAPPLAPGQVIYDTTANALKRLPPPITFTKTFPDTTSWISPITGLVWASGTGASGGGGGGYQEKNNTPQAITSGGGGSGGGEWAGDWVPVTEGHSYPVTIGAAGTVGHGGQQPTFGQAGTAGTATTFVGDSLTLTANGGQGGEGAGPQFPAMGGQGGLGSTNSQHQPGGAGGAGAVAASAAGGGGGGSGSPGAPGGAGGNASGASPGAGGVTGPGGGIGGAGGAPSGNGVTPTAPGAGAGGGGADDVTYWNAGGGGRNGSLTLTWTTQTTNLTPIATTVSSDTTTPGTYLSLVNTDNRTGLAPGEGSIYGWGIGNGRATGASVDGNVTTEITVSFTADGHTDYQLDAKWGIVIPEAGADLATPSIPAGQCQIIVMIDGTTIDTVFLDCAAHAGATFAADAGSFTCWTSSKNGTTPSAGKHTAKLAIKTAGTTSGGCSGAHIGDLASVGAAPFGAAALPAPYLATLVAEQSYLRVSGISSAGT